MLAPEPFFEARGTPFSEYHRIRALTELGHTVDLVTYPFGEDVDLKGLRVFRCPRPPFVRRVRVGPSLAKVALDVMLAWTAVRRARSESYDAVHSHEEGSFIGVALAAALRVPHLYDMHSSLPQQLTNFGFSRSRVLTRLFASLELLVIRRSRVVIVICPQLEEHVRRIAPSAQTVLIENAPGSIHGEATGGGTAVRHRLGLTDDTPIVLYAGTFEPYQGLDLLLASAPHVVKVRPDVRFVLVGGRPEQVETVRQMARHYRVEPVVTFAGQQPADAVPSFLDAADVLVSPRSSGTNTPLKIYQYLRCGRPIVATRLITHTQVLSDEVAILTGATPEEFAAGIVRALSDRQASRLVAARARELAETKYNYEAYLDRTRQACARLRGLQPPGGNGTAPREKVAGGVA
ncbi:MAG: glycosyltransferase family 4 protein [Acidobacteria bacterium]|nr:glycosyltransferase family 4 protein [Acidobacteriota bacterium]